MILPVSASRPTVVRGLEIGELLHVAVRDGEREQLRRGVEAGVEVDRVALRRPESVLHAIAAAATDAHVVVERAAELLPRRGRVGDRANVDLLEMHELEIVGRRERDHLAVGREAHRAFGDVGVLRQALDLAARDLEEIEIGVVVLLENAALVAAGRHAVIADVLAVGRDA